MNKLLVVLALLFYSLPSFSQYNVKLGSTLISTNTYYEFDDVFYVERFVGLSISYSEDFFEFGQNNSNTIGIEVNTNFWIYGMNAVWFNPNIGVYFSKSFGKSNLYSPLNFGIMSIMYQSTNTSVGWDRENKMNLTSGLGYSYGDLLKFYAEVLYSPVFNTDKLNPLRIQVGLKWKILKKYN